MTMKIYMTTNDGACWSFFKRHLRNKRKWIRFFTSRVNEPMRRLIFKNFNNASEVTIPNINTFYKLSTHADLTISNLSAFSDEGLP